MFLLILRISLGMSIPNNFLIILHCFIFPIFLLFHFLIYIYHDRFLYRMQKFLSYEKIKHNARLCVFLLHYYFLKNSKKGSKE